MGGGRRAIEEERGAGGGEIVSIGLLKECGNEDSSDRYEYLRIKGE